MKIITIQIALFFKDIVSRPDFLAEEINKKMGGIFDAMPVCIDLPLDAPAEIPLVQRKSNKIPHMLNVSRNRCDLILTPLVENSYLSVVETRYNNEIVAYIKAALEGQEIVRTGIIYTVFQEKEKPCEYISEKYFNGLMKNVSELSFRVNKVTSVKGNDVNCILNATNAISETNGQIEEGILLVRDINNVVDKGSESLTFKQLNNICKYSYTFLDENKFGEVK